MEHVATSKNEKLKTMVRMAVLAALSIVLVLVVVPIIPPFAGFLRYDPGDVPILVASFLLGPVQALLITAIVCVIQAVAVSPEGGWVGIVMHFISTGTFALIAGLIYRKFKTFKGAVAGLILGSIGMTLIMIPSNLFFTVRFYGVPYDVVKSMLPTVLIPFNFAKSGLNSLITLLVYKPLSNALKKLA